MFVFTLPVAGHGEGRNKKNQQIDTWWQQLGTPVSDRRSLQEGAVLIERALKWIEGEKG